MCTIWNGCFSSSSIEHLFPHCCTLNQECTLLTVSGSNKAAVADELHEHALTAAGGQALEVWCYRAAVTCVKYPYGVIACTVRLHNSLDVLELGACAGNVSGLLGAAGLTRSTAACMSTSCLQNCRRNQ